jgi:glycosyltransferase involved in cell wall biosynthesis
MDEKIDIILAVHNGAGFIEKQIKSILNQTYKDWRLIVRDEASDDETICIVKRYVKDFKNKILLVHDNNKSGACQNFAKGLELSDANYCMFADCDDYWLSDKVEKTFKKMKTIEAEFGESTPTFVFTDLKVVDKKLDVIDNSFWRYQNLNPDMGKDLNNLLIYNVTTGCTVMMNKALRELALPIPKEAVMHDNWTAMVASVFGKIDYLKEPTILYRQHGKNDSGARKYDYRFVFKKIFEYMRDDKVLFDKGEMDQAEAFLRIYGPSMKKEFKELIHNFIMLKSGGSIRCKYLIIKNRFFKPGILRNIGLLLRA